MTTRALSNEKWFFPARYRRVRGIHVCAVFNKNMVLWHLKSTFLLIISPLKFHLLSISVVLAVANWFYSLSQSNITTFLPIWTNYWQKTAKLLKGARYRSVRGIQRKIIFSCAVSTGARYRRGARSHREITVYNFAVHLLSCWSYFAPFCPYFGPIYWPLHIGQNLTFSQFS